MVVVDYFEHRYEFESRKQNLGALGSVFARTGSHRGGFRDWLRFADRCPSQKVGWSISWFLRLRADALGGSHLLHGFSAIYQISCLG